MVIKPDDREGNEDNSHHGADQWLFVVEGESEATINDETIIVGRGTLLLIERYEKLEIRNSGKTALRTLNF